MEGWIKIHRKLLDWEWYSDANMTRLWLHLLLSVNHKEKDWRGLKIKVGQMVTSVSHLAIETGLSVKQIRLCLDRLERTSEVAIETTNKYTLITICKYEDYQVVEEDEGQTEGQAEGQTKDNQRATTKECKNINKEISTKVDTKKVTTAPLPEREKSFYESLIPFVEIYGREMIRNFYNYWSQVNPNGKKMLWEMQRVFDIKKRLVTWSNNEMKKPDAQKTKMDMYQESLQKIIRGEKL